MQVWIFLKVTIIFTCILKLRSQEKVEDQEWEHLWRKSTSLPAALGTFTDIAPDLSAHQLGRGGEGVIVFIWQMEDPRLTETGIFSVLHGVRRNQDLNSD